ncbi:MAG: hypothetical protein QOC82_1214 [Frankiaceae bacterium]|nr:hypothetical protein [Frankiaceae bacterium]
MPETLAALRSLDERAAAFFRTGTLTRASVRHVVLALLWATPVAGDLTVLDAWDGAGVVYLVVGVAVLLAPGAAWRIPILYRVVVGCLALAVTALAAETLVFALGLLLVPLTVALWSSAARPPRRA